MREIWIPEFLGSFFTLIYLIRPLFKGLWSLEGIAWFPILALGVALALFPAYGFRPEYLPLLVYQGLVALACVKSLLNGRRGAGPRGQGLLFTVPAVAALVFFTALALWFAPLDLPPVKSRPIQVRNGGRGYTLRVFDGRGPSRGLIFLIPPGFGGVRAVDGVCAALGDRGFTVISYTRSGLRSPGELARLWSSFRRGTVAKGANEKGRALEDEKRREFDLLLPYVMENLKTLAPGADGSALFLAGWGAGGSALYSLASEQAGPGRFSNLGRAGGMGNGIGNGIGNRLYGALGLVAVESRLWSAWEPELPPAGVVEPDQNPLLRALGALRRWFARLRPTRIQGPAEPRPPAIPVLYLVSGRALDEEAAGRDYGAVFAGLRNSQGPAALAALEGAGPLDYSDFPAKYPLYSALFPGPKGAAPAATGDRAGDSSALTAALIARFCELAAGAPGDPGPGANGTNGNPVYSGNPGNPAETRESRQGLYLETRYWNLGDLRLY
jgi:hypothetical protein